ncbi:hypothetical protein ABRZ04_10455 [Castellaniella ginsengisoli]|uniref:Phage tail protein n=1 Tax=Castellaniella ginsengisoli TaxID=546114 RepID=A0AB39CY56_9BURK
MLYSASTGGFYSREINGDNIPADAVEITAADHAALLQGQTDGQRIVSDESGRPVLADPIPAIPQAPRIVTRAQGKAALIQAGLWSDVLAYVDTIEDPTQQALARVALDDTTEWRRDSLFLATAAAALGLSDADLDGLFEAAFEIVL